VAVFVADLLEFSAASYATVYFGRTERPLHDPCAVLAVTHPHLFEHRPRHVVVETRGEHTRGMTVVDERTVKGVKPANVRVGYGVDADGVRAVLMEAISACSPSGS
jgi:inosine-uridine nucleoside N-ribohydrolase